MHCESKLDLLATLKALQQGVFHTRVAVDSLQVCYPSKLMQKITSSLLTLPSSPSCSSPLSPLPRCSPLPSIPSILPLPPFLILMKCE